MGQFKLCKFAEIDLNDCFFDSLKEDYPLTEENGGFVQWFMKKSKDDSTALLYKDEIGIGAFICLKDEYEPISLIEQTLEKKRRKKISTIRVAERYRGNRIGEGSIGLALWNWQKSEQEEIYVTVYLKHSLLIEQLVKFGFKLVGHLVNGECVYLRSKSNIDYSDPYKSFPFINPNFNRAGFLIVDDVYHDTLFPYSDLMNTVQEQLALSTANGVTKIYIGSMYNPNFIIGEPVFIYRKFTGDGQRKFKSCITSYCIVTDIIVVKRNNSCLITEEALLDKIKNKSVFDKESILLKFNTEKNLVLIELLYFGFFGAGNNLNNDWLTRNGYFQANTYPTENKLSASQFVSILKEGNVNVSNVIIH